MKKIILISLFGLMFSQTEVSQKIFELDVYQQSTIYTLDEIIPEYQLDWAVISIIGCTAEECFFQQEGNTNSSHTLRMAQSAPNQPHYYPNQGMNSSFFAPSDMSIEVGIGGFEGSHTIKLLVTAEFPIEDTGYIEEGFDFCLVEGNNLVAFPCDNPVSVETAIPELAQAEITQIIGAGQAATNLNGQFIGSLSNFTPGAGYWFKSSSSMCFNYACAE